LNQPSNEAEPSGPTDSVFAANSEIKTFLPKMEEHCAGHTFPCVIAIRKSIVNEYVNRDGGTVWPPVTDTGSNPGSGPENPGDPVFNGTRALVTTAAAFSTRESTTNVRSADVTTQGGRLLSWSDPAVQSILGTTDQGTTSIVDTGNLGQISWGRFVNGTLGGSGGLSAGLVLRGADSYHYIVASPTPNAFMSSTTHLVYTQLVGGTSPTSDAGVGHLTGAFVDINATIGSANATVSLVTADQLTVAFNHEGTLDQVTRSFFSGTAGHGSGTGCSASCSGTFSGVIAGPQAQYAGFAYDIRDPSLIPNGVRGTAVLRR
jgi:hypothetical protein